MTDVDPWEWLQDKAATCTRCALSETRTNVVFGVGSPRADLMFVGEAPGKHEDLQGIPFVGRAGQLLTQLAAEIELDRDHVYIANVLKCRPPSNRDPLPGEIEACTPFLDRQIRYIRPAVLVTLGNFATKYLLRERRGITRLRGQRFPWREGTTLIPTFHPSAAIRPGGAEKLAAMREDFALVRATIDEARAGPADPDDGPASIPAAAPVPAVGDAAAAPQEATTDDAQLGLF